MFKSIASTADLNDLAHYDVVKFTQVLLKIMPDFDFQGVIRAHIHL